MHYPTAAAYWADLPNILAKLGFTPERAAYLQAHIDVEPSRGPGHAMPPGMIGQKARLRTRVEPDGMNYKGFNIAVHEMGHNIEETFSMNLVDYHLLAGVPNTAFTEALAMMTQGHDLEVLGLTKPDARNVALSTLNEFWATAEISGVALVDMGVWHWMYDHPGRHAGRAEDGHAPDRARCLESLLCAGPRPARCDVAGDLLAHDQRPIVPAGLSDRPSHRIPGRRADPESGRLTAANTSA